MDGDRDKLGRYIRLIADTVGLRDWFLDLGHGDPPGDNDFGGQCHCVPYQKKATIWLRSDWTTWPEDEIRHTVVHELLHCHLQGTQVALEPLADIIGNLGASIMVSSHHAALELAIDGMAYEWSKLLPLPSQWEEDIDEGE